MIQKKILVATLGAVCSASMLSAQDKTSLNFYGAPGLIEMPSAEMMPDAELSMVYSDFPNTENVAISFQFLPSLSMTYRIQKLSGYFGDSQFDGSWDLAYQILEETDSLPSVSVGFRDFLATGITASQYVVATKTIADQFKVTAGAGWGRLSDSNEIQTDYTMSGGGFRFDEYFSGPAGFFGGVEWATPIEGVIFKAEYSSDRYVQENDLNPVPFFDRKSDFNFGIEYQSKLNFSIGAYYLYGSEIGFKVSSSLNPRRGRPAGYIIPAPLPIQPRDQAARSDLSWLDTPDVETVAANALRSTLAKDGIGIKKIGLSGDEVYIVVTRGSAIAPARTFGRVARALTYVMPESVETFKIAIEFAGFETVEMTVNRSDLEELEFSPNGVIESARRFELGDAPYPLEGFTEFTTDYPKFSWSVAPYFSLTLFSAGDQPAVQAGIAGNATVRFADNLSLTGSLRLPLIDGQTDSTVVDAGPNESVYFTKAELTLTRLSLDQYAKLSDNVYGKFNAGIFSSKWAGVGAEVLYKPADQRWGVGFDLNYVKQRDSDTYFEFIDYDIVTGHASYYYSAANGFDYTLSAGRYLAGDWGATLAVDRTFDNGWRVGVFSTVTDMPASEFGDGRFQKGFRITIPLGWALGTQTRRAVGDTVASVSGEGGSRLSTPGNLYGSVSAYHTDRVSGSWGAFWK